MHPLKFPANLPRLIGFAACAVLAGSGWMAQAQSVVSTAASVVVSDATQTYDGTPLEATVATEPAGLAVETAYRPLVYDNSPAGELSLSYGSLAFGSQKTYGVGKRVGFEGAARRVTAVEVILVTWARAADYPDLAVANPEGYRHPVTVTFYNVGQDNNLTFIGEGTSEVFVPWRPETLPNGDPYPHNGFAFRARVDFATPVTVSGDAMMMLSYDTQSAGFSPIGVAGPYDKLNLALGYRPRLTSGWDPEPGVLMWVREEGGGEVKWGYPNSGWNNLPMFRVIAEDAADPTPTDPPVDVGRYDVAVTVTEPGYEGFASSLFLVDPAEPAFFFSGLDQVADGSPKPVAVTTDPAGLNVLVTYDGSATPPSAPGSYHVVATVDDPNGTGSDSATLVIRDQPQGYVSWAGGFAQLADNSPSVDFDQAGLGTGIEWVVGGNPADPGDDAALTPTADTTSSPGSVTFTYRRTQAANDDGNTTIRAEYGSDLDGWTPAVDGAAGISINVIPDGAGPGIDLVEVNISNTLAVKGRLFARLWVKVTTAP